MNDKYFELTEKLKQDLALVTEIFLLRYDDKIESDSYSLNIILTAYVNVMFGALNMFSNANENLKKNIDEFKSAIINALQSVSFLKVNIIEGDNV